MATQVLTLGSKGLYVANGGEVDGLLLEGGGFMVLGSRGLRA